MKKPSDTYDYLYDTIVGDLLSQICNSNINYCVREKNIQALINKKIEEYRLITEQNMSCKRLDRHKLASCVCGAIIDVKPLMGLNHAIIVKNANEKFALHAGMSVLKYYMIIDLLNSLHLAADFEKDLRKFLSEQYELKFPSLEENICDAQEYKENFYNALHWATHYNCDIKQGECFRYDVWAYSKIFYHLEVYNRPYLEDACNKYINSYSKNHKKQDE